MDPTTRRGFLGLTGAATAGLAGCTRSAYEDAGDARLADALFRVDLGRRGVRPDARVPGRVERSWRLRDVNTGTHTAAKASVVPAPTGDLLVPGDAGTLTAVRPDGRVRWQAHTRYARRGIHGTPAVANDTAYIGAYDGALYAFDLRTGRRRWRTSLGDAIGSSPAYHAGTVYIAVEFDDPSGALMAVDAGSGRVEWRDDRPTDQPHSSPAIDLDAGRLVVGSNDGSCYAWDYPSHAFRWRVDTGGPIKGPIATADGAAFFGSWDGRIYRVALDSGTVEWTTAADDKVMSGAAVDALSDTAYIGSHDRNLYALDAGTGEERWRFGTDGAIIGCPAVAGDHVLVGSYDRRLYALDRVTGEPAWSVSGVGWVTSTPLVHDGAVYYTERATPGRSGSAYKLAAVE